MSLVHNVICDFYDEDTDIDFDDFTYKDKKKKE